MSLLPSARGPRTLVVGILLAGVYFGYSQLTAPWLDVTRVASVPHRQQEPTTEVKANMRAVDAIRQLFSGDEVWVQSARKWFRDGDRYLFFNESDMNEALMATPNDGSERQDRIIRFSPVAFVWQSPDSEAPVTVTAAAAELERSPGPSNGDQSEPGELGVNPDSFGRIVGGLLRGPTRIRGADGLLIEGQQFHIDENAMKLWSSQPVSISWEDNRVVAESGVDIHLLAAPDSDNGLMSVSDIQSIHLNGRVRCDLTIRNRDRSQPPTHLKINAPNGFAFQVQTRIANFFGIENQRKTEKKHQIHVEHPEESGHSNHLYCSRLTLQLRPKVRVAESQNRKRSTRLEISSILAEGSRVEFHSEAHGVTALTRNLRYTIDTKTLELWHGQFNAEGNPFPVVIRQADSETRAPRVVVVHGEANSLRTVELIGPGFLVHRGELERNLPAASDAGSATSETRAAEDASTENSAAVEGVNIRWKQSFLYREAPDRRVLVSGDAEVTERLRGLKLLAEESIEMTLKQPEAPQVSTATMTDEAETGAAPTGTAEESSGVLPGSVNFGAMQPDEITARKNVRLVGPQVSGRAREQLVVRFQNADSDRMTSNDRSGVRTVSASEDALSSSQKKGTPAESEAPPGFTHFESDTLEAVILNSESSSSVNIVDGGSALEQSQTAKTESSNTGRPAMQMADVWLKGNVSVDYSAADPGQSFNAAGNTLLAKNGFEGGRDISLFGDPARIISSARRIEGQRIDLSEVQRLVTVDGSGRIRVVMDRGIDGKPLETPSPLDIYWGERMTFSGVTASFIGSVRAVMKDGSTHEIELKCAGMQVHFSEDVIPGRGSLPTGEPSLLLRQRKPKKSAQTPDPGIERIHCESLVQVTIDQLTEGKVTSGHRAEFSDLKLNLVSGDFSALGPGWIESTQPDQMRRSRSTGQDVKVQANTPTRTADAPLSYLKAEFIDSITGNLNRQYVRLNQHVSAVYGPVRHPGDKVIVDAVDTENLPAQAVILQCETLTVAAIPATPPAERSFSLTADHRARLRSQLFSGDADHITYDHSKNQFVLVSDDGQKASVSHRAEKDGSSSTFVGRRFEYYPKPRNKLVARDIDRVSQE